jgi:hypothetical protein
MILITLINLRSFHDKVLSHPILILGARPILRLFRYYNIATLLVRYCAYSGTPSILVPNSVLIQYQYILLC